MRHIRLALRGLLPLLLCCASCAVVSAPAAPSYGGSDTRIGVRRTDSQFDEEDYAPVDRTTGIAFTLDHVGPSGSGFEIQAGRTDDSASGVALEVEEISLGYRHRFGRDVISTFVGLGAAYVDATSQLGAASSVDNSIGAYGQIGLHIEISQSAALEVGARGVFGTEIEIGPTELDVDYFQWFVGLTFGM